MKNAWLFFWTSRFSKANLTIYAVFHRQNYGGDLRPKWRRRFAAKMTTEICGQNAGGVSPPNTAETATGVIITADLRRSG